MTVLSTSMHNTEHHMHDACSADVLQNVSGLYRALNVLNAVSEKGLDRY